MRLDCSDRLLFLDDTIVAELNRMLAAPGTAIMPHVLSVQLGIDYSGGLAIIVLLASEGACNVHLLIYHSCEPDLAIAQVELRHGKPSLPWKCPNCETVVESYSELSFDIEATMLSSVEVI
jgi:hypothetical protein